MYDSGEPYVSCGYPYGGYRITQWNFGYTCWIYVDNSPDMDTLTNFFESIREQARKMSIVKPPHKLAVCEQCGPHVICGYCGNNCCNGSSGRQVKDADCDCTEAYEQQNAYYTEQRKCPAK